MAKAKSSFVAQALPFFAFITAGWYGIATVVQNKRDLRVSPALRALRDGRGRVVHYIRCDPCGAAGWRHGQLHGCVVTVMAASWRP